MLMVGKYIFFLWFEKLGEQQQQKKRVYVGQEKFFAFFGLLPKVTQGVLT